MKENWKSCQFEIESRPSNVRHYWNRPQYWEESWRPEETCCFSDCREKPLLMMLWKTYKEYDHNNNNNTWAWLRKGNLKRETESLLIAAQDNSIKTNHIKARIDKTQQNRKCRLCGDRDETINHIISECSKLVQKEYNTRHVWVGKVIHWEMCKKLKFDILTNGICTTQHLS